MLQKVENLLKKFWKGIVIILELIIVSIFIIDISNSQNEFKEFKNSKAAHYFWNENTYKNNNEFSELFILKNTDLINNIRSLSFDNKVERIEICAINGDNINSNFNYMITSNKKGVIKNIIVNKNKITIDITPNVGIAQVKIGFKNNASIDNIKIEDQLLVKIFNSHNAD